MVDGRSSELSGRRANRGYPSDPQSPRPGIKGVELFDAPHQVMGSQGGVEITTFAQLNDRKKRLGGSGWRWHKNAVPFC